jgi:hypothetical protein
MRSATLVAERFFVRKQIEFCASAISTVIPVESRQFRAGWRCEAMPG